MTVSSPKISVSYDRNSDVLYIALGKAVPAKTRHDDRGLAFRFAVEDGHPCGVTIMGYKADHWIDNIRDLANIIGGKLHIQNATVLTALENIKA